MATAAPRSDMHDFVSTFRALSDPVRLDLFIRIAGVDEMACTSLVDEANVAASTVSYHVKALKACGLVDVRKSGRNFYYRARAAHVGAMIDALVTLQLSKSLRAST